VDRAKAAFARALDIDAENVEGMVGAAVLDMMNLDETSSHFNSQMEKAIKMMGLKLLRGRNLFLSMREIECGLGWNSRHM
jgi:hypothetical protein